MKPAIIFFSFSLITLSIFLAGCGVQKKDQQIKDFSAGYHYTAEVSYYDVRISGLELTYTYLDHEAIEERCKNWIKQMPCWTSEDLLTVKRTLSKKEVRTLIKEIEASGAIKLNDYYGPEKGMRCYPYTLKVKLNGIEKQIVYCSRPDGPPEPEAFTKVKALIRGVNGQ